MAFKCHAPAKSNLRPKKQNHSKEKNRRSYAARLGVSSAEAAASPATGIGFYMKTNRAIRSFASVAQGDCLVSLH